jgi:hypothetical protein
VVLSQPLRPDSTFRCWPQALSWPTTHVDYELIAAGMLIMAGGGNGTPMDYRELERWTRVGYERGMRPRKTNGKKIAAL